MEKKIKREDLIIGFDSEEQGEIDEHYRTGSRIGKTGNYSSRHS